MSRLIGLLRGVNVGGKAKLPMQTLRDLLEGLGFTRVQTLLASGNVVFETKARKPSHLEKLLDKEIRDRVGMEVDFFVRTYEEIREAIDGNPFAKEAAKDPARFILLFLRKEVPSADLDALRAIIKGRERIETVGRHAYVVYPDGQGTSRLTNAVLERYLGRCTARNWNTVLKLADLAVE
jgi:uncharacterized protein (DUF1697 family)